MAAQTEANDGTTTDVSPAEGNASVVGMAAQTEDSVSTTTVSLTEGHASNESVVTVKKPHRVLHFSDGTWEENSDDDEPDGETKKNESTLVDASTLPWMPWFTYQAWYMGSKSLEVCDYLGEKLATFFGITTPKYQYVIDEYNRMVEMEKQAQKQMDVEMGAWVRSNQTDAVASQPKAEEAVTTPPPASVLIS